MQNLLRAGLSPAEQKAYRRDARRSAAFAQAWDELLRASSFDRALAEVTRPPKTS